MRLWAARGVLLVLVLCAFGAAGSSASAVPSAALASGALDPDRTGLTPSPYDYDHGSTSTTRSSITRYGTLRGYDDRSRSSQLRLHVSLRVLAAKAGGDALRTVAALTREQDAALAAAMRDPNKLRHIFGKPRHNLGPLTRELGGQEALMREAVLAVPRGTTGTFEVTKRIGTYDLTVRGRVVNGVPRIGTVFVP